MKILNTDSGPSFLYRAFIFLMLCTMLSFCKSDEQKPIPSIGSFAPTSGFVGDNITISGTNFSETSSAITVQFNGTAATLSSSTKNEIVVTVPANATSGKISVSLNGKTATSSADFTVLQMPAITSFSPVSGPIGTTVTITGTNFSPTPSDHVVKFNGTAATVTAATSTSLTVIVPSGATTGKITISLRGKTITSANDFTITLPSQTISSFAPVSGFVGTSVTITGANFSATASDNTVKFNGTSANVTAASTTSLTVTVPAGANTGKITVDLHGITATSANDFTVIAPSITSFSPAVGTAGTTVTITGSNFNTTPGNNVVKFNGTAANVTAASATSLTVTVPVGASTGKISVDVNGSATSSSSDFTVYAISSFSPTSGPAGTSVTITGSFDRNYVIDIKFNGTKGSTLAATNTTLVVSVPDGATSGKITVDFNGQSLTSSDNFTVTPAITSFSPTAGEVGSTVTITGTNFSTTLSDNIVKFNGTTATVTAATATSLSVIVPSGATDGYISIGLAGQTGSYSSANKFTVTLPVHTITSFSPGSGSIGSTVNISGNNFDTRYAIIVKFNGTQATLLTETLTMLSVYVPSGASSGKISVEINGHTVTSSNDFYVIPVIGSFSPGSGPIGTTVTLTGSGFSPIAANNIVQFNGVTATVLSANATSLMVSVPTMATTGKIKVSVGGYSALSASSFQVTP
jgi:hypothetical protein